jgi:SAM-dependent methyltransferase
MSVPDTHPTATLDNGLFDQAMSYERSSGTQMHQGRRLLQLVRCPPGSRVLDVGCGTGSLTLALADTLPNCRVDAIDISGKMVLMARTRADTNSRIHYQTCDLMQYAPAWAYNVVFSNATMHWVLPTVPAYRQLFSLLASGGLLVVGQGGAGNYQGLWRCAQQVIKLTGRAAHFQGWSYPASYPTKLQMEKMLSRIGFSDIEVRSEQSDGTELPTLYRDFSEAGLLPVMARLPLDDQPVFRDQFLAHAEHTQPSRYTHRLVITARRPS